MTSIASLVPKGSQYRLGSSGPTVKEIQNALARLGYKLSGTGYFGNGTDTAVEAFQRRAGLDADGVVGPATAEAIDREISGAIPAPAPEEKAEIEQPLWLQAGIKLLGVTEKPGKANNPEIIGWALQEGGSIARSYTADSIPFCALGIGHCLTLAGLKGTGTLWALDYAKWGVPLVGPAVGAIMPMKRDGGGHVAMVVGRDKAGRLMGLGFNQGDTVSIIPFPRTRPIAYRWPAGVPLPADVGFDKLPIVSSSGKITSKET